MVLYENPISHLAVRRRGVKIMVLLSGVGIGLFIFLNITYFPSNILPILSGAFFYLASILYLWQFYKIGKEKVTEKILLKEDSFEWKKEKEKQSVKYSQVKEVERVNDSLYIVHYQDDETTKQLFLYWAIAEEIEERAGIYPWGTKKIKRKFERKQSQQKITD